MTPSFETCLRKLRQTPLSEHTEPTRISLCRTIFPQMSLYLPEEEGAQLRLEFETEMTRLEAV